MKNANKIMYKKVIDQRAKDFPNVIEEYMPDFKQVLINLGKE